MRPTILSFRFYSVGAGSVWNQRPCMAPTPHHLLACKTFILNNALLSEPGTSAHTCTQAHKHTHRQAGMHTHTLTFNTHMRSYRVGNIISLSFHMSPSLRPQHCTLDLNNNSIRFPFTQNPLCLPSVVAVNARYYSWECVSVFNGNHCFSLRATKPRRGAEISQNSDLHLSVNVHTYTYIYIDKHMATYENTGTYGAFWVECVCVHRY